MSDKDRKAVETGAESEVGLSPGQQEPDEHTTAPNPAEDNSNPGQEAGPGKWQMPKPKFQQTSGYLPQGYIKDMQAAAAAVKANPGSEDTTREHVVAGPTVTASEAPAIEPQPDLTDQLVEDEIPKVHSASSPEAGRGTGVGFIIFGIVAIVAFMILFLAAVYFLFLAPASINSNF